MAQQYTTIHDYTRHDTIVHDNTRHNRINMRRFGATIPDNWLWIILLMGVKYHTTKDTTTEYRLLFLPWIINSTVLIGEGKPTFIGPNRAATLIQWDCVWSKKKEMSWYSNSSYCKLGNSFSMRRSLMMIFILAFCHTGGSGSEFVRLSRERQTS